MRLIFDVRYFSARLVLGFFIVTLITALSAGVPAYWLTRTQLERQVWSHVADARQATHSLFQAKRSLLANLTTLLADRPTLKRLIQEEALAELTDYLHAFQDQSDLDILLFCDLSGQLIVGEGALDHCPAYTDTQFVLINDRPAMLATQTVQQESPADTLGLVTTGIWLEGPFLRQLAGDTGLEQTILLPDSTRLASSLVSTDASSRLFAVDASGAFGRRVFEINDQFYYAVQSPLMGLDGQVVFISEVALPVTDLINTETWALTILILSTSLATILGLALAVWFVRQVTAPLQQLTAVAQQISAGDLVATIPAFATPIEISTLAKALQRSQASMLRALEERSQARDWLNNLIQSVVEGVVTFDTQGRVTFLSQGAEALLGWRSEEALGKSINELLPLADESGEQFVDQMPPADSKRQISIMTRSGKTSVLAVTGARLVPPNGETMQVALVLRDVTQEEAARHLRSYFLANISHEFLTPLSTLNASMELLMDEVEAMSPAEIRELIKPTYLSLIGLQTLIDNLLTSSRIEAGQFSLNRQLIDLNRIIADALRIVQPLFERRRQVLSVVEWTGSPDILGDPSRLTQVLVNLLSNAGKYSPVGEQIDLQIERRAGMLRLSVADRGPGIAPAERINLFRRFVRLNPAESEQYGIGLGLYVVKTTVEAHGGRVGIDDRPGGGSIFWFELPLASGEAIE